MAKCLPTFRTLMVIFLRMDNHVPCHSFIMPKCLPTLRTLISLFFCMDNHQTSLMTKCFLGNKRHTLNKFSRPNAVTVRTRDDYVYYAGTKLTGFIGFPPSFRLNMTYQMPSHIENTDISFFCMDNHQASLMTKCFLGNKRHTLNIFSRPNAVLHNNCSYKR